MNPKTIVLLLLLTTPFWVWSQEQQVDSTLTVTDTTATVKDTMPPKKKGLSSVNDGPYIFIEEDQLVEKRIVNGEVVIKNLPKDAFKTKFKRDKSKFKKVQKIAALSDIHGQHELAVEILTNHNIIDADQNWIYGEGHLIIVGDIFDRGDQVNESLWLFYKLEQQAKDAGGKVHVLLGNHEYLVFSRDLRYIHGKYKIVSALLKTKYTDLYGENTVIGRWLRSRSTIVKINDNTFVHGGISKEFLGIPYNRDQINSIMRESIDIPEEVLDSTGVAYHYFGDHGPVWYRGYFYDDLPDKEISDILSGIRSKHIVVGHCSNETVVELYDGKVYGVDSSIKLGEYGDCLLYTSPSPRDATLSRMPSSA